MDESDAADLAIERLADQLRHDMRLGEYADKLSAEIQRMLASKDQRDIDGIEDMSLADIIDALADKMANAPAAEDIIGEMMTEIMEDDQCSRADAAYERSRDARDGV